MIVEFGKFARAEEKRVRALLASLEQRQGASSFAPMPVRSPSTPSRAPSTRPYALSARYRSAAIRTLAIEAHVLVQRAYAALGNSPRMPEHPAGAQRSQRAVRHEDDGSVNEAVQRLGRKTKP